MQKLALAVSLGLTALLLAHSHAFSQDLALDLRVEAGSDPETATVELFPSNEETTSFRLHLTSANGSESLRITSPTTTLSNLASGESYAIYAEGLAADGTVLETSPHETFTTR